MSFLSWMRASPEEKERMRNELDKSQHPPLSPPLEAQIKPSPPAPLRVQLMSATQSETVVPAQVVHDESTSDGEKPDERSEERPHKRRR